MHPTLTQMLVQQRLSDLQRDASRARIAKLATRKSVLRRRRGRWLGRPLRHATAS